ncbi:MAG: sensor histidine kinase [Sulfuritalea sp.]|nr:sensor histidine kinase [Sulfuritalea sp.]
MAFKFAARTLLELGKELISSDEVAMNELVKNAVDAGSPSVHCFYNIVLTHHHFQEALDLVKDGSNPRTVLERLRQRLLPTAPEDQRNELLEELGASLRSPQAFVAALQSAYDRFNWIEVRDRGHGMSLAELDDVYLTVGTRSRRKENVKGAEYLGDKGVGRLSAMRLGNKLSVITTRNGEHNFNCLDIDWNRFGHDIEAEVSTIHIEPTRGEIKPNKTAHGTIIRISGLNGDWTKDRLNELLTGPIARMLDPFEIGKANELLRFEYNGERLLVPNIPEKLLAAHHAKCTASLRFEGNEPVFEGILDYRLRNASRPVLLRGAEVLSVTQKEISVRGKKGHAAVVRRPIRSDVLRALGPFDVEIYWYNRLIVEAIAGLTAKIRETRDQIARWAGGPMLYRYGFRVLPYGDPDDDWLELDKKAFGQRGFKLNRQQVIGRVRVTSPHVVLSEQTNREGLVDSPATSALKALIQWLVHVELRDLINDADARELLNQREAEKVAHGFLDTQQKIQASLKELRSVTPNDNQALIDRLDKAVAALASQCASSVRKIEMVIDEAADEREKFVHLAGIGLITEFIFHELDRSVTHALNELTAARREHPRSAALRTLEEQLNTLFKRISAFDALTGEKRQAKINFEVGEVVDTVLAGHENQFSRHKIEVRVNRDAPFRIRAARGMLIQILENLISNSVYWLIQQTDYESGFAPRIDVEISAKKRFLSVTDNGPGVDPDRKERIFHPFVTSKPANTGRGLGLYISRELADYHGWKLYMEEDVGAIRPNRLNTFVLEMGNEK